MSRKFVNYYEILGVSQNANENQIRKAYGEKLREYRQLRRNRTDVDFNILARAYRVLIDEDNREHFDRRLEDYLYQKELRRKQYEESKVTKHKPLSNSKEILEEVDVLERYQLLHHNLE